MIGTDDACWRAVGRSERSAPLWTIPLTWVADHYRTERLIRALASVQSVRGSVEDIQSAMLHFAALPTRQDVRQLQRRVVGLRRRVAELDLAIARLERASAAASRPSEDSGASLVE
jgi:hypothetical protein